MLELYHHGSSACAAKVRFALAEKQLQWTGHYVDILAGEQFKPEFLAVNPKAVVPVLIDDSEIIPESTVICEYVEEAFPAHPIYPHTPLERAHVRLWTNTRLPDAILAITGSKFPKKFTSHDLRRTVATRLAESLGDEGDKLVRRVLGHSDGSVTAIYNRYGYVKEMRRALEQWANDLTSTHVSEQSPAPAFSRDVGLSGPGAALA